MILRLIACHENAVSPLGERVARDGAFTGRRGSGEGVLFRHFNGSEESHSVPSRNDSGRDRSLRSLEDHVIPAKAGIHCSPGQQWTPAFAGVTTHVIFIPLGGSKTRDHSE
jgi:hypothetical protein